MTTRDKIIALLAWTPWKPLQGAWLADRLPNQPGLYRIRREGCADLDYIGQTGSGTMTLKKRLGMLRGVYQPEMPYRDPHTAGPALWALRHATGCEFEVSVVPIEGSTPWRKGLECIAISLYREAHGWSPTVSFGRMPSGYRMSSGNNAHLVAANRRLRGGPIDEADESHLRGVAPLGPLTGDPVALDWCGHAWSPWEPLSLHTQRNRSAANGLYHIRRPGGPKLLYIGQGRVSTRLNDHQRKASQPASRQADLFAGPLECSVTLNETWYAHQRLELENDLIAAYILHTGEVPPAQFLG